jgi:holliday junction DNA helicase RuvA
MLRAVISVLIHSIYAIRVQSLLVFPYFRCQRLPFMYAYLQGKFTFKNPAQVYVDVNGIGFEVNISLHTYTQIQPLDAGRLFTHLQVKEDGHVLFGFFEKEEKELFVQLISVSGIGAATARMMLSHLKPDELASAILLGNIKLLESIKGIGKKTAERLVLELKDKLGKNAIATPNIVAVAGNSLQADALNALVALGIPAVQADKTIQKIKVQHPEISNLEQFIKKALQAI